ncbi:hypothetical protein [Alishewanella phage vB_AspM_Slickus01]|nr:hypothetical protein [Alishewanella phage vB_AspM_Slickus01]
MSKLRFSNGRFMKSSFHKAIKDQWESMIDRNILPLFEFQIGDDSYLMVNLEFSDQGIEFSFDIRDFFEPKICFGGDVILPYANRKDVWMLPFDPYFDNVDRYIEQIHSEITEGFLCPNDLMFEG